MAEQRTAKQERRAAAKAAAARAAQVRKRNQALAGAGVGLAVVAVLVAVFFFARSGGDGEDVGSPALTTTASPTPAAVQCQGAPETNPPPVAGFPPVPAGADPALKTKPVVDPGSGTVSQLAVTPIIKGKGAAAKAGQTITVNYVGACYASAEVFDASWNRSEPFTFQLGAGNVIPGWDQGLVGVTVGSRVQLDIPANLAYGDNPEGGAPAGPLRFVVDLLAVK